MQKIENSNELLTSQNLRKEMKKMFEPFQQKIAEASQHFKEKYQEYKDNQNKRQSVQISETIAGHQKTPSLFSDFSYQNELKDGFKIINEKEQKLRDSYNLCEWQSSKIDGFRNTQTIHKYYHQLFTKKKIQKRSSGSYYDFKKDQKEILLKLFQELKDQDNYVSFDNITSFFSQCRLYYLCYNIKPSELDSILKQSAHTRQDALNQTQFLNLFYIDRPNITGYDEKEEFKALKRCILSQDSWKDLKNIFSTLDTFGDETIYLNPFIYKVKNNYSNRGLINEPAIDYPQINRTISVKKVIFNIEYRGMTNQKIKWQDIQHIFNNYVPKCEPTIDTLYKRMIQRGQIGKFTNNFMLDFSILQEIKNIYYRCPKYCETFVNTKFICKEFLQSNFLKNHLKQAIVRVVTKGIDPKPVRFEEQIRIILQQAESFLDLDELLEYFSIKGPINTIPDETIEWNSQQSSDEQQEQRQRLRQLDRVKSVQKIKSLHKTKKNKFKLVRHLTVCEEFNLSKKKNETIMEKKTKMMKKQKQIEDENEMKKQFKANPIPVQINPERYKAFIKKLQQEKDLKRQHLRKKYEEQNQVCQYLRANTLLFHQKSRKTQPQKQKHVFSPKPIPWFVGEVYMLDKINRDKQLRRKAINNESKKKMLKYWNDLPNAVRDTSQFTEPIIMNFDQQQTLNENKIKVKEVPNFKQLHKQFAESLDKKKAEWKPTQPIQFKLSANTAPKRVHSQTKNSKQPLKRIGSTPQFISKEKINIPTTLKQQQMTDYKKQKLNQQLKEKEKQLKAEKERVNKQKNFAKFMRRKLNQTLRKSQSLHHITQRKIQKHREDWNCLKKKNQQDLCRIYFNVMSRPFLFQNNLNQQSVNKKSSLAVPLKKKGRKFKQSHQTSKHIHQSPLKVVDAENYEEVTQKKHSPEQYQQYQEEQSPQPFINQSF